MAFVGNIDQSIDLVEAVVDSLRRTFLRKQLRLDVLEHLKPLMKAMQDAEGRQGPDGPGEVEA